MTSGIGAKKMHRLKLGLFNLMIAGLMIVFTSCSKNDPDPDGGNPTPTPDTSIKITLDPAVTYQEMVGFGGALTWYCDRVTRSSKKEEILDLMVNDLGADIVRLKNWYYPLDYPNNKVPDQMEATKEWFKQHFDATNELYTKIKSRNPGAKILLSSWGPPSALKSNNSLNEGTLKKDGDRFMYDEFATYWVDVLDHISFSPDYISMQNEPNYVNPGWETCEWAAQETATLPGYVNAIDTLYQKIKDRQNLPVMVGPEAANLSTASFKAFADKLVDNGNVGVYTYHPYNLNESSSESTIKASLSEVGNFSNKPNFMTEYSGMSWLKTGKLINDALKTANSSAYIYWELMWAEDSNTAMVRVDTIGNYTVTPFYYLIKHYAKHVDAGYERIDVISENSGIDVVAFKNPENTLITLVLINTTSTSREVSFELNPTTIKGMSAWSSTEDNLYVALDGLVVGNPISLKSSSITTVVLQL